MTLLTEFRAAVDEELRGFLVERSSELAALSVDATALIDPLSNLAAGGKRLRPLFAAAGALAAGGDPLQRGIIRAATSLELVQLSALIHDDLIDGSDTRRGLPSAHRAFEQSHTKAAWTGDAEHFGFGTAVLLGDLALAWAGRLFHSSGLSAAALSAASVPFNDMLTEVTVGQYLDLLEQHRGNPTLASIQKVLELKTAKYTVERPLHIGALAVDAGAELLPTLSTYGLALGVAFQLRDDLLGVFGDPAETGKPAGDDLREGKQTALIAIARERVDATEQRFIDAHLGNRDLSTDVIAQLRELITGSGAVEVVESIIDERLREVNAALDSADFSPNAKQLLSELAVAATKRSK